MRTVYSFGKIDASHWGVKAVADYRGAEFHAGEEVDVTKRDGSVKRVRLGALVAQWNGGRAALYEIRREVTPTSWAHTLAHVAQPVDAELLADEAYRAWQDRLAEKAAYAALEREQETAAFLAGMDL